MTERQRDIRDLIALDLIDQGYALEDVVAVMAGEPGEIESVVARVLMHEREEAGVQG